MQTLRTLLLFSSILVGLIGCVPSPESTFPIPSSTPVQPIKHQAANITGVETIWTLDDVYVLWNTHDRTLDASGGKTCLLGNLGKRGQYKDFICLESSSGQLLWLKENGVHSTIAVTQDGIIIAYSSGAYVNKFDFQTGDLVWRVPLEGTGSIYLYYLDPHVQVSTANPDKLWTLDIDGEIIRMMDGHRTFISANNETYISLNGLQVLRTDTDQVLWKFTQIQRLRQAPLFTAEKIFLRSGESFSGTAYALNRANGDVLWEVPYVIGNLTYSAENQLVYALQEDGSVLAIDENSGQTTVVVQFSPNPFIFLDGVDPCAYQLSYDPIEHILVVYLGDSKQLFAFSVD